MNVPSAFTFTVAPRALRAAAAEERSKHPGARVEIWTMDEHRIGLKPITRGVWAPIGERLLSAHANENALFGFDSIPFLATSFDESVRLMEAAKPALTELLDAYAVKAAVTADVLRCRQTVEPFLTGQRFEFGTVALQCGVERFQSGYALL